MKMIIDIPEETYNAVCWHELFLCPRDKNSLVQSIKKAVPLDSVKAEIVDKAIKDVNGEGFIFLGRLLRIFDSIGKGDKE